MYTDVQMFPSSTCILSVTEYYCSMTHIHRKREIKYISLSTRSVFKESYKIFKYIYYTLERLI
jgi:hypothetical protein